MRVDIYSEQCAMAGRIVTDESLLDHDSPDYFTIEGTPESVLELALTYAERSRSTFWSRVARVLKEQVYDERPELDVERWAEEDAELFAEEFPGQTLQPSGDWDTTAWNERLAQTHLSDRAAELAWPIYSARLAEEIKALAKAETAD